MQAIECPRCGGDRMDGDRCHYCGRYLRQEGQAPAFWSWEDAEPPCPLCNAEMYWQGRSDELTLWPFGHQMFEHYLCSSCGRLVSITSKAATPSSNLYAVGSGVRCY